MIVKVKSSGDADDLYIDADNEGKLIELNQEWEFLFIDKKQAVQLIAELQRWVDGGEIE